MAQTIKPSDEFLTKAYNAAVEYGYIDEPQEALLHLLIESAIEQLRGSGVPPQEGNPEYLMAVSILAAYRYSRRATIATNMGANEEDGSYLSMVRGWVWRLRTSSSSAGGEAMP